MCSMFARALQCLFVTAIGSNGEFRCLWTEQDQVFGVAETCLPTKDVNVFAEGQVNLYLCNYFGIKGVVLVDPGDDDDQFEHY